MLELGTETAEQPKAKKAKLDIRSILSVHREMSNISCQVHATADMSFSLPCYAECRSVNSIVHDEINASVA